MVLLQTIRATTWLKMQSRGGHSPDPFKTAETPKAQRQWNDMRDGIEMSQMEGVETTTVQLVRRHV